MRPETRKRIRELGYKGWTDYCASPHWQIRRAIYFETHTKACWICGSTEHVHLHHVSYEHIGAERDHELLPLCRRHHRGLHSYMKHYRAKLETAHLKYAEHLANPKPRRRRKKRVAKKRRPR
jgi:hypothetical protein